MTSYTKVRLHIASGWPSHGLHIAKLRIDQEHFSTKIEVCVCLCDRVGRYGIFNVCYPTWTADIEKVIQWHI